MKAYLPHNLDIDKLIAINPPEGIENFHKDKLMILIDTISRSLNDKNETTEIYSKKFQKLVDNYKPYLDYLVEMKIIEINKQFQHNELVSQCRAYKFSDDYSVTVDSVEINYPTIVKKEVKRNEIPENIKRKYKYLTKWFNPSLNLDINNAIDYLNFQLPLLMKLYKEKKIIYDSIKNTWYDSYPEKKIALRFAKPKDPVKKYNRGYILMNDLNDKNYHVSIGNDTNRLTTVLTLMPSEFRNFIKYDNQNLVAVDISNSIPYLSLKLFEEDFWDRFRYQPFFSSSTSSFSSTASAYCTSPSIILRESLQSIDKQEFELYKELVLSGEIYEYFRTLFEASIGFKYQTKKQLKEEVFRALFSGNQFIGGLEAAPKRIFREKFPGIYSFFSLLKKGHKEFLPNLLMRIESYFVLDVITKRIAKENPKLPIFTIHDNIATIEGWQDYVMDVIRDELTKFIGYPPKLKEEFWKEQNLKFYTAWKAKNK